MDLMPRGGSLDQKFLLNAMDSLVLSNFPDGGKHLRHLALRIARANHNCNPNAGHIYDDNAKVAILFANRDIQQGEEICISYTKFSSIQMSSEAKMNPNRHFLMLKTKLECLWGIVCPADCYCNDVNIQSLLIKGQELQNEMHLSGYCEPKLAQPAAAMKVADELFKVHDLIQSSLLTKVSAHYDAFQIASMSRKTLPLAYKHIQFVYDVFSSICPYSTSTIKYEKELKDPALAMNYCGRLAK